MKAQMAEKKADKAVGRTKGGWNTKLHAVVDGLGNPVEFLLSAGNDHDSVHAVELLKKVRISESAVLADRAYGARTIREYIWADIVVLHIQGLRFGMLIMADSR